MTLVGATVLNGGYGVATKYQAATQFFDPYVGRPMAVTKQKWYLDEGVYPAPGSDYLNLQAAGCQFMLCVKPLRSAVIAGGAALAAEQANLTAAIAAYQPYEVCLWQECNQGQETWFTAAGEPTYLQYWAAFAPTVAAAGVPVVVVFTLGSTLAGNRAISWFPTTGTLPAKCYYDWYGGAWNPGESGQSYNPDTPNHSGISPMSVADGLNVPVGLGEWGTNASGGTPLPWNDPDLWGVNCEAGTYTGYLVNLFETRLADGKTNADIGYYSGNGTNGPVTGPTDYKVPALQRIYDLFSTGPGPGPAAPGRVPVTVPSFTAGYGPGPDDFNGWIQAPFAFLTQRVVFRASLNNNGISLPSGVNTLLPFDTVQEDPYKGWIADESAWQCPNGMSGTYLVSITAAAQGSGDTVSTMRAQIGLNGSPNETVGIGWAPANQIGLVSGAAPVQLFGGQDTVSGYLYWVSSGTGQVSLPNGRRCTLEITWYSL